MTPQAIEAEIARIDAQFRPEYRAGITLSNITDALVRRWELSIMRDELRAEHARMSATFDTCL